MKNYNKKSGFTLVELLLYITILSGISFLVLGFVNNVLKAKIKQQIISEVERQGFFIADTIKNEVKNSDIITYPEAGNSFPGLTLNHDGGENVSFLINNSVLYKQSSIQGGIAMHNNRVSISQLNCFNLTSNTNLDSISCSFILSALDEYNRFEYTYQKKFDFVATRRY